ncbi:ABC transporter permease subunit [Salinifilum ghardaiensis]
MVEEADVPELAVVRSTQPAQPDGAAEGYRARRTLPVRVEFARQLRRRRTRITLGVLAATPLVLLLGFALSGGTGPPDGPTLADNATGGGLNFTAFTLFAATNLLLVVVVALFFGDTVASEAVWSSLRYLLAAPVPRTRLLRQKALVAALLSLLALALLLVVSLAVGLVAYGAGEMITPTGETVPFTAGLLSLVLSGLYLALHLSWIAGLALWLSVSTDAPLGAVGGAVLVSILSQILDRTPVLGGLRSYLPTHHSTAYVDLLRVELDWSTVPYGVFSGLAYAAVFCALAVHQFRRKDITS